MTDLSPVLVHHLPDGFTFRPTTMGDAEAFEALYVAEMREVGRNVHPDPEDQRNRWQEPNFVLADSSIVVENSKYEIVATATLWDNNNPPVRNWMSWNIHPSFRNLGIEEFLIDWLETTAQRVITKCPPDVRIELLQSSIPEYTPREKYLLQASYELRRVFQRMIIHMDAQPDDVTFPTGLSVKTYHHPTDLEVAVETFIAGFRDHYGWVDEPFEDEVTRWRHFIETDEHFDETLWFMVMDDETGDCAAVCFCRSQQWNRPDNGYVMDVSVRPDYRRRGIASAMLRHSFADFWKRGIKSVALHVDSTSLTGANELYTRVGMHVDESNGQYAKVIREGKNLAKTSAN